MNNVYDRFRRTQEVKKDCRDERSAAFINDSNVSHEVMHVRLNQIKQVALVFNDKEGPDEVFIYSKKENKLINQFIKSDYFVWKNIYYLVYEDVQVTNSEVPYIKQRAIECNVIFTVQNTIFNGAFFGTMRRQINESLLRSQVVVSNESPMIMVPRSNILMNDVHFIIENKPWKITDYDNITNKGISYLYLDKYFISDNEEENEETIEIIENEQVISQEENLGEEVVSTPSLYAMVEYTFSTKDAYFASNPKVEIIERRKNSIKFIIPFGINSILISTKNEEESIVEVVYKVVIL